MIWYRHIKTDPSWVNTSGNIWGGVSPLKAYDFASGAYLDRGSSHWLDNRSEQTLYFRFQRKNLNRCVLSAYNSRSSVHVLANTDNRLFVELQGTGSMRFYSTTTFAQGETYDVVVRINNAIPSGTARVAWDLDMFVGWVKETVSTTGTSTNTDTFTALYFWANDNTPTFDDAMIMIRGAVFSSALTDEQCQNLHLTRPVDPVIATNCNEWEWNSCYNLWTASITWTLSSVLHTIV